MRIVVFAPHSAIWIHAFPEALVADALKSGGHEIVYVSCGRVFEQFCIPMAGHRLSCASPANERKAVCDGCASNERMLRRAFGFEGPSIQELLTPLDFEQVVSIVRGVDRKAVSELRIDGLPIGRIAAYQFILRHKRAELGFDDSEWPEYEIELRNSLLALKAFARLIEQHRPDRLLVYNGLYSVNRVASLLAEANGIPAYFLHAGQNLSNRLQTMMVGRGTFVDWIASVLNEWPRFADRPCAPTDMKLVSNHFLELVRGRNIFVYSQGNRERAFFDLHDHFGVSRNQKVLVACMSSYDEELALVVTGARPQQPAPYFPTQVGWISAVIEYVRARPELFLIVRVHPREFPNRREARKSEHAALLESALQKLPDNVRVNWPQDNISLYDLADGTDVFLNAWSSAGKEMAMLGIPVVLYSRELPQYPVDINYLAEARQGYFATIERAIADGWDFETARRAYRWLTVEFIKATIFLGDSYPELENRDRPLLSRIVGRLLRLVNRQHENKRDIRRRRACLGAADQINSTIESCSQTSLNVLKLTSEPAVSIEDESAALREELLRIGAALFPTPESKASSRLYRLFTAVPEEPIKKKQARS